MLLQQKTGFCEVMQFELKLKFLGKITFLPYQNGAFPKKNKQKKKQKKKILKEALKHKVGVVSVWRCSAGGISQLNLIHLTLLCMMRMLEENFKLSAKE